MLIKQILINWNIYHKIQEIWNVKVEKVDVHKLVPAPVDLNKLIHEVKNDIVKKDVY